MKTKTKLCLISLFAHVSALALKTFVFAVKVAVAVLVAILILGMCSCSSTRTAMTETAATESMAALETATDSVGSNLEMQTSASGYLDISDLQIIFYPPNQVEISDSMTTTKPMTTTKTPIPAMLNIGRLSAGSFANTALKASTDSVSSSTSDLKHDESTKDSEKRIRDPTRPSWPVILSLFIALIIIIYTGFMLYQSNRL